MARKSKTARAAEAAAAKQAQIEAEAAALLAAEQAEDAETEAEEEQIVDRRRSIVPPVYKARYGKKEHCGDDLGYAVSELVRDGKGAIVFEALRALADENGLSLDRWSHLNPGQQSMNLRNVLRGRAKRGETVVVGGQTFGPVPMVEGDL